MTLDIPFPWFGGKSRVAPLVWSRFGNVPNYVEPFFGSGAILFGRAGESGIETVNDLDGFIANFWRAIQQAPEETAYWADWPVNENDLHARHLWLRARRTELSRRLEADPNYCDPKIAGWWVWGISCWIGRGWCDPNTRGPWQVQDGMFVMGNEHGVSRRRPHLGDGGRGLNRQLPHLSDAGMGVKRQRPHLTGAGMGVNRQIQKISGWFTALSSRLRCVRVCCGDWLRVLGPSPTEKIGMTGVFLDPPYSLQANRDEALYASDDLHVAHDVREWAIANGDNRMLRIALCGYEGEHQMPESWECIAWKATGGYANLGNNRGKENCQRERIWFSPYCMKQNWLFEPHEIYAGRENQAE